MVKRALSAVALVALAMTLGACDESLSSSSGSSSSGLSSSIPHQVETATGPQVEEARECISSALPEWEAARDAAGVAADESGEWHRLIGQWARNRKIVTDTPGYLTGWTSSESDTVTTYNLNNGGIGVGSVDRTVHHPATVTPADVCATADRLLAQMREMAGAETATEPKAITVTVTPTPEPTQIEDLPIPRVTVTAETES